MGKLKQSGILKTEITPETEIMQRKVDHAIMCNRQGASRTTPRNSLQKEGVTGSAMIFSEWRDSPFPKKNLVPLGSEYLFDIWWSCFERTAGPQKNCRTTFNKRLS